MTFRPAIKNRYAHGVFTVSLFLVFLNVFIQSRVNSYKWAFQIAILIFSIVLLEVLLKYILSDYVYELRNENFMVYRINGKRSVCVASIALSSATKNILPSSDYKKEKKNSRITLNFCKNMSIKEFYVFCFDFNGKKTALKFEPDDIFISEMNKRIKAAKEKDEETDEQT